ncbi:MAG: winged helix-turn-helix domain-containing protein [Lachnospiraceae bacterium]|nr:winged helix-turn-helix domain-containing protein [Lachnospiraceae bacterium]
MYKFTKIYSGGEPDLEEGDVFRLTVPLINNSSENSAIGNDNPAIDDKNQAFETEKLAIDGKNSAIEDEKLVIGNENPAIKVNEKINMAIEENKFSEPTRLRILMIYRKIGEGKVFGTSDIAQISGCSSSTAHELLRKLREMNVIEKVKGNGKGRYMFISE